MQRLLSLVVLLALSSACSDGEVRLEQRSEGSSSTSTSDPERTPPTGGAPPSVNLIYGDKQAELQPFTYCYASTCADGSPDYALDIGDETEVHVEFPLDNWSFEATFTPAEDPQCGRRQSVALSRVGGRRWRVDPAGPVAAYRVIISGRGKEGDVHASLRWTTTKKGPSPKPEARLAILADHDGAVDSYGIELSIEQLRVTPAESTATITVTSNEGRSLSFDATRSTDGRGPACRPTGTIFWDGPDGKGKEAARLGTAPFRIEVAITLDGSRHTAKATWPDDVIKGNEPSVHLLFDPPLRGPD